MNIAFIKQKYVSCGGGEIYLMGLMTACSSNGHEVHLIAAEWEDAHRPSFIVFHQVHMSKASRSRRVQSFSAAVTQCVEENDFDCVFSSERTVSQHVWRGGDGVYKVWLKRRTLFEPGYKNVFNRISAGQNAVLRMEKECVHSTAHLIANSNVVKKDLLETYPGLESEIHVIHNGFDPQRFSLEGRVENRKKVREKLGLSGPMICYVASGWKRKALVNLLEAMQRIPDAVLVVAGRDRPSAWKKIAKSFGVESRVHFIGTVKDVAALYHASDVAVLPSWFDSFGFVGLESMACGTPYVTTRWAGSHEIIEEGVNGYVVSRPDAINELAQTLNKALLLPAGASIANTVAHLTVDENMRKTLAVIEKAVA